MTIDVERVEVLGINVHDVAKAKVLLADLFGVDFRTWIAGGGESALDASSHGRVSVETRHDDPDGIVSRLDVQALDRPTEVAIDTSGLFELIESHRGAEMDVVRNIHFKVQNLDAAVAEIRSRDIGIVANVTAGGMREVVLDPDDLFGARICLVEYAAPSLIDAMLQPD